MYRRLHQSRTPRATSSAVVARRFEEQLVVDREDHPARPPASVGSARVHVDHRLLQDVGGGALNRQVHGHALGGAADLAVLVVDSGTSRRRPNIVFTTPVSRADCRMRSMNARTDGKPAKYASMKSCAVLPRDADVFRKRERRLSVEQRVVDDLRASPQLVLDPGRCRTEDLQAVRSWMSSFRVNASISASSPDMCASTRSSICE